MSAHIIVFAGSARTESVNKKLAKIAAGLTSDHAVKTTFVDLADYPLPLYDGDLEAAEGIPENAKALREMFKTADGFIISSPEYNSSISPLLKNTIDWISRPEDGQSGLVAFQGKVAAIIAASPGALGGLRGLTHIREILSNIGTTVIPAQMALSSAFEAFNDDGTLKNEKDADRLSKVVNDICDLAKKIAL